MKCPRDGASLIREQQDNDLEIDSCPTCAGLWLDRGELEELIEGRQASGAVLPDLPDSVAFSYEMSLQEGRFAAGCPRCNEALERREYAMASQVMVDACTLGHGMWLDAGEFEAIEAFVRKEKADNPKNLFMAVVRALLGE